MPARLTIRTLGQLTILLDGQPVTGLASRTAEALLVYLMCQDRPLSRQVLADFFWDDRSPQRVATNLRTLLTMLRKPLDDFLVITRQSVAFDHSADYWLDAAELEQQLVALNPLLESPTLMDDETIARLRAVLDLYQGDFLEGFYLSESRGFEEWTLLTQERLRRLVGAGLGRLVSHCLESGDYQAGIRYAGRLLSVEPYHEAAHRQMMWLLVRSGQRNAALQQYQRCRRLLAEELAVEPASVTTALYERIRGLAFPPPCVLPPQPSPFIGREEEMSDVLRRLANPHCRLLTIIGPGGVGKTRLALQVVQYLAANRPGLFLDGVYFVSLASLQSAAQLATTVAHALNIPLRGPADPGRQLLQALQDRELLLVLDNLEHLLAEETAVGWLADLLQQAPQVKLLVTSRERLKLREEWLFDVPGLDYPPEPTLDADRFSAVQLFLHNAERVSPHFAPQAGDLAAIAHVCRLLEGLPLGLELASAWVRQYTCQEITQQIEESLDFLATSLRNVPQRHRSLRAVFDHSWRLLPAGQQSVFALLAIFPDSFAETAVAEIVPANGNELAELADKSLLQREPGGRFALHPVLRQFAAERSALSPAEQEVVAGRHAAYYLHLVAQATTRPEEERRQQLRAEFANVRTAWQWAVESSDFQALAGAAPVLYDFFALQSWFQEGLSFFQDAIAQLLGAAQTDGLLLSEWLAYKARLHLYLGQMEVAQADLARALDVLPPAKSELQRAKILGHQAIIALRSGDYGRVEELANECLRLAESAGNSHQMALALTLLGSCQKEQGNYVAAREAYDRALVIYEETAERRGAAMVFNNLGNVAQAAGNYEAAQQYYRQSTELFKSLRHQHGAATTLTNAGRLAGNIGDYEAAERLLLESLAIKRAINSPRDVAVSLANLGDVAQAQGQQQAARNYLVEAFKLAREAGDVKLTLEILASVAEEFASEGKQATAGRLATFLAQYPAASQEVRQRAGAMLATRTLKTGVSPAASADVLMAWVAAELGVE